jgi:hypothetical protein
MPWEGVTVSEQKQRFIEDYLLNCYSKTELAERFNISRKTAHKRRSKMKLSTLMVINANFAVILGIAFVLVTAQALSLYGITVGATLKYLIRLFGGSLLGYAL